MNRCVAKHYPRRDERHCGRSLCRKAPTRARCDLSVGCSFAPDARVYQGYPNRKLWREPHEHSQECPIDAEGSRDSGCVASLTGGFASRKPRRPPGSACAAAYKWLARYRAQGQAGLRDRSSRPLGCPHRTSEAQRAAILALRRARCTYREISRRTGVAHSTVGRIVQQAGLNRLSHLDPAVAPRRYVYPHPGDLLHLDVKRLGRFVRPGHRVTGNRRQNSAGAGWEYVHVAIDDHSRVSFCLHPTQRNRTQRLQRLARHPALLPDLRRRLHPRNDRQRLLLPL